MAAGALKSTMPSNWLTKVPQVGCDTMFTEARLMMLVPATSLATTLMGTEDPAGAIAASLLAVGGTTMVTVTVPGRETDPKLLATVYVKVTVPTVNVGVGI